MKAYIDHYILTLRMSFPLETKGSTSTRSSSTIYIYSVYFWGRETQNVYGIKTTQLLMHVLISNAEEKCSPPSPSLSFIPEGNSGILVVICRKWLSMVRFMLIRETV